MSMRFPIAIIAMIAADVALGLFCFGQANNAFDYYLRALNEIQPPGILDDVSHPATEAEQRDIIATNSPALATLHEGIGYVCVDPPFPASGRIPEYSVQFPRLASLLAIESSARAKAGDDSAAMDSDIDAIKLGTDVGQSGPLLVDMVGWICERRGRSTAWGVIDGISGAQAAADAQRLEALDSRSRPIAEAMKEDENGELPFASHGGSALAGAYKQYMDALIAQAAKPYPLRTAVSEPDGAEAVAVAYKVFAQREVDDADNRAQDAMLTVALALRAYEANKRTYPTSLDQLVPRYLDSVPTDPFAVSSPLSYRLQGSSFVLYSVGPDSVDDGGTPIVAATASLQNIAPDSKGDIVAGINP